MECKRTDRRTGKLHVSQFFHLCHSDGNDYTMLIESIFLLQLFHHPRRLFTLCPGDFAEREEEKAKRYLKQDVAISSATHLRFSLHPVINYRQ